ncbi:MAG: hypothetical protein JWN00_5441 [Actinomycetia bacterium]|nr:hypothetical protein [Actinomycetes bacterium]
MAKAMSKAAVIRALRRHGCVLLSNSGRHVAVRMACLPEGWLQ